MKTHKLLAILHLPPPYHGASMINQQFANSTLIRNAFSLRIQDLTLAKDLAEIDKFRFAKLLSLILIYWRTLKSVVFDRPDVVYVTSNSAGLSFWKDFFLVLILKVFRIPHCMHFHNKGFKRFDSHRIGRFVLRIYFWNATVVLLSDILSSDFPNIRPHLRLRYCAPGVTPPIAIVPPAEKLNQKPRVLFLSNLIVEKGVYDLLDACAQLKSMNISFECVFAGQPVDISVAEFNERVNKLGVSDVVRYVGPVFGEEKHSLYCSANIFAFPTYYKRECFPLVLLEAMSYGLPVVSTNEAAIPSYLMDGYNGFVCDKTNSTSLANALRKMLTDKELVCKLGQNSIKLVNEKYTVPHYEANIVGLLSEVANGII